MSIFRRFVQLNKKLSVQFDRLIPSDYRIDGNACFQDRVLPPLIENGARIYDLGGGSRPYITADDRRRKALHVVGLDISDEELVAAPRGSYDQAIVADLTRFVGPGDGDLVICQATLEHVPDTDGALRAIASCLKPGGRAAIFAPSRNALFARLNLVLPERVKKKILFSLFPEKATGHEGFQAYYDRCTPSLIRKTAERYGLEVESQHFYWKSSYFSFFTPLYVLWRLWLIGHRAVRGDEAAETFAFIFRKSRARLGLRGELESREMSR